MTNEAYALTHDLVRAQGGAWRCVNCGQSGPTIGEVSDVACSAPSTDNSNVLAAIDGTLGATPPNGAAEVQRIEEKKT